MTHFTRLLPSTIFVAAAVVGSLTGGMPPAKAATVLAGPTGG